MIHLPPSTRVSDLQLAIQDPMSEVITVEQSQNGLSLASQTQAAGGSYNGNLVHFASLLVITMDLFLRGKKKKKNTNLRFSQVKSLAVLS